MPDSAPMTYIQWPEALKSLKKVEASHLSINGSIHDLNVQLSSLNTNVGSFVFKDEFKIQSDTSYSSFNIIPKNKGKDQIQVANVALGQILNDSGFGNVNGVFGLTSAVIDSKGFKRSEERRVGKEGRYV